MTDPLPIVPVQAVTGQIRPPGSKSLTNRALVCAALAEGQSILRGALDSDDTQAMVDSLARLGIQLQWDHRAGEIRIAGSGGRIPTAQADLFVGNSGTTARFLTAMAALGHGVYRLDGNPRMRQRPIADLIDALAQLGARVESAAGTGCPPVVVHAHGLDGGSVMVRGDVSSQFLSGLLMAAPYARQPVDITVAGPAVSRPYITMTCQVMRAFGVTVNRRNEQEFHVPAPATYQGQEYAIEPDASAASYFWAAAAIAGGPVKVVGLTAASLQGDVRFCQLLEQMGCSVTYEPDGITVRGRRLTGIAADMNTISDTVQTLAAVALFAEGPTTISNVAHIRHKETDRIGDLARELRRLGAQVDERADGLCIIPGTLHGADVETYDDHRMAMSLALVGLRVSGVRIKNPECTGKTYPDFFRDLQQLCREA